MGNGSCIDEKMVFDIMKEIYIKQENIKSANKTLILQLCKWFYNHQGCRIFRYALQRNTLQVVA